MVEFEIFDSKKNKPDCSENVHTYSEKYRE